MATVDSLPVPDVRDHGPVLARGAVVGQPESPGRSRARRSRTRGRRRRPRRAARTSSGRSGPKPTSFEGRARAWRAVPSPRLRGIAHQYALLRSARMLWSPGTKTGDRYPPSRVRRSRDARPGSPSRCRRPPAHRPAPSERSAWPRFQPPSTEPGGTSRPGLPRAARRTRVRPPTRARRPARPPRAAPPSVAARALGARRRTLIAEQRRPSPAARGRTVRGGSDHIR